MKKRSPSQNQTSRVVQEVLGRVRRGAWPVGKRLPSERTLIEEFKVSRVPLREALSSLRALGVLETRPGSGTRVARVTAQTIAQLLPLLVTLEGERTFAQIFELRLALETQTAALAAERRADHDLLQLRDFTRQFREDLDSGIETAIETDLDFHVRIAEATHNPLFAVLMKSLAELVKHVQRESCQEDPVRRRRAVESHEAIVDAIDARDPQRARAEMEAHLRTSASRFLSHGGPP